MVLEATKSSVPICYIALTKRLTLVKSLNFLSFHFLQSNGNSDSTYVTVQLKEDDVCEKHSTVPST